MTTSIFQFGCCLNPKGWCFSGPHGTSMKNTQTGRSRYFQNGKHFLSLKPQLSVRGHHGTPPQQPIMQRPWQDGTGVQLRNTTCSRSTHFGPETWELVTMWYTWQGLGALTFKKKNTGQLYTKIGSVCLVGLIFFTTQFGDICFIFSNHPTSKSKSGQIFVAMPNQPPIKPIRRKINLGQPGESNFPRWNVYTP